MTKQTVGVIGVGMMGHGIARNIQKKGWPLAYLDHPGNQPSDDLDADGARRFDDASALAAACDVLILCVTGSPQIEALLLGPDSVTAALQRLLDRHSQRHHEGRRSGEGRRLRLRRRSHDPHAEGGRGGPPEPVDRR